MVTGDDVGKAIDFGLSLEMPLPTGGPMAGGKRFGKKGVWIC